MSNYTPLDEFPKIHAALIATFRSHHTKPLNYRITQLHNLVRFVQQNANALADCLNDDLSKPRQEAIGTDIGPVVQRALSAAANLEKWLDKEDGKIDVETFQKNWKVKVEKSPKGVVLIIVPWNYPVILSLQPLIGAIAAGCCAAIKMSEMAPSIASFIAENLGKYVDPKAYKVILGGVPEITKVLELKWDHIINTGNSKTARIIASAAAKHLMPLTLELGGKSPVIVDASSTDLEVAAKRVMWGKVNNAGQICVAPDYVLFINDGEGDKMDRFVRALGDVCKEFYGRGAIASGPTTTGEERKESAFSKIVNDVHFKRLKGLLEATMGRVVVGGKMDETRKMMEPTVVVVEMGDVLLEEEIFGPILPVLKVRSVDEAIEIVNQKENALTLYLFTEDDGMKQTVVDNTTSGQVVINDTVMHLTLENIPFGGIGESGSGRQFGKFGFDELVYERPVVDIPMGDEPFFAMRYPPYTKESMEAMKGGLDRGIPSEELN